MNVEYWENNSGGYYRLGTVHWDALALAGWEVGDRGATLRGVASLEEARASWEKATGLDSKDPGCSCCGKPHQLYESYYDEDEPNP